MAHEPQGENTPRWPTVEEQLKESRVRPGSALEKLILENQNFEMLRPEEFRDRLRIPFWLRVYFPKNHPELTFKAGDPTGGYPLALRDLYIWMIDNQDLRPEQGPEKNTVTHNGD